MNKPKKVIIYTTPTCPYCKMAIKWLEANHIEFEKLEVHKIDKYADEMVKKSGQMGVPVIDIDGEIIVGYDPDKLKKALEV